MGKSNRSGTSSSLGPPAPTLGKRVIPKGVAISMLERTGLPDQGGQEAHPSQVAHGTRSPTMPHLQMPWHVCAPWHTGPCQMERSSSSHWEGAEEEAGWVLSYQEGGEQTAKNCPEEAAGDRSKTPAHKTSLTKCKLNSQIPKDFEMVTAALNPQPGTLLRVGPSVTTLVTGP